MPVYKTNGAWGTGQGVKLSATQADGNIYELRAAIDAVIASPVEPVSPTSITRDGLNYIHHYSDDTTITVTAPVITQTNRGEWLPLTLYSALDFVTVAGVGGFMGLIEHTSPAVFDPDQEIDGDPVWQKTFSDPANAITSAIYDLVIPYQGRLSDMTLPIVIPMLHAIRMPAAGAHLAHITEPPSIEDQVLPLLHNATQIGTVTFLLGEEVGTIVITADETIAAGEFFSIGLPADADATAAGMSLAFAAQRIFP